MERKNQLEKENAEQATNETEKGKEEGKGEEEVLLAPSETSWRGGPGSPLVAGGRRASRRPRRPTMATLLVCRVNVISALKTFCRTYGTSAVSSGEC